MFSEVHSNSKVTDFRYNNLSDHTSGGHTTTTSTEGLQYTINDDDIIPTTTQVKTTQTGSQILQETPEYTNTGNQNDHVTIQPSILDNSTGG